MTYFELILLWPDPSDYGLKSKLMGFLASRLGIMELNALGKHMTLPPLLALHCQGIFLSKRPHCHGLVQEACRVSHSPVDFTANQVSVCNQLEKEHSSATPTGRVSGSCAELCQAKGFLICTQTDSPMAGSVPAMAGVSCDSAVMKVSGIMAAAHPVILLWLIHMTLANMVCQSML